MPNNGAQQTAQAQQGNQLQAEQFFAAQQAKDLQSFLGLSGHSPAQGWGAIRPPSFAYSPPAIGGGSISGPRDTLKGATAGWNPTPPGGTPSMPAPGKQRSGGGQGPGGGGNKGGGWPGEGNAPWWWANYKNGGESGRGTGGQTGKNYA